MSIDSKDTASLDAKQDQIVHMFVAAAYGDDHETTLTRDRFERILRAVYKTAAFDGAVDMACKSAGLA